MTSGLFPRLDALSVDQCLGDLDRLLEQASWPLAESRLPASTKRSAVGGTQITMSALDDLRKLVVRTAFACGFPERGSTADRARFDAEAARALAECEHFAPGEADRDDVWAFIATVLLPDVVAWRFSGRSSERFHGGVRNTFQRLWMRAWSLDRGADAGAERWKLVEMLTEDALVQLTERPSIGADRRFSLAIANAWVETADQVGRPRMEDIMRLAIIELRIRSEIQLLAVLEQDELQRHVSDIFARVAGLKPSAIDDPARGST